MELHSYAKHRTTKKWSLEQKRRLVEARIKCDGIFQLKPKTSLLPWKSVICQAKLDDFNIVFVRKQWANMVTKYMQYKQERLGNKPTHDIDAETVKTITQEWEFFQPIHRYMTRKTTDLHSYALTKQQQQGLDDTPSGKKSLQQNSASSNEHLNACSSDTNDALLNTNTDHDFYSKRTEQQQCYFADVEEDTLESITTETVTNWMINCADIQQTQEDILNGSQISNQDVIQHVDIKSEEPSIQNKDTKKISESSTKKRTFQKLLNERDKYYRYKRRYHKRMECRFDGLLNVIGQVVKSSFPNVDISPILQQAGGELMNSILTSSSSSSSENEFKVENET